MAYTTFSAVLGGIEADLVRVEIDSSPGLHDFSIVGLGDKAVHESIDRIGSAIKHCGFVPPGAKNRRFVVNLAPADLKKEGSGLDLPIAAAYLAESGQITSVPANSTLLIGELGLDGRVAHTRGVLAAALRARSDGYQEIIVPVENAQEAAYVGGLRVIGAPNLAAAIGHLTGIIPLTPSIAQRATAPAYRDDSWAHIAGQLAAKRALVVAAAGSHNILMSGSPGSGKTLLARALVGLLPPLTPDEALESAKILSSVGLLQGPISGLTRPFCAPHHTASPAAIVGGGTTIRAGQATLAHRGVLFMDEMPEFPRNVLEALRQPLEDGNVTVSRASGSATLPARFMLVAAMNPCPCGNLGDPAIQCVCSPVSVSRYAKRISGPLLDRIDIHVFVSREKVGFGKRAPDSISSIRDAIAGARTAQTRRFAGSGLFTNSEISHRNIDRYCSLEPSAEKLLASIVNQKGLSLRGYHKIKKIGRTLADLEACERIAEHHIAEALALRVSDRIAPSLS